MNVFMIINKKEDLYLIKQTESFFNKNRHNISITFKCINNFENEWNGDEKFNNFMMILLNHYKNINIYDGLNFTEKDIKIIEYGYSIINENIHNDIFCFSIYNSYIDFYLLLSLYIKKIKPSAKILFGGASIILYDNLTNILKDLYIDCSTGDMEVSLYNYITDYNNFYNKKHKINLNTLNKNDVPKYTQEEIQYLDYSIMMSSSRGCANNCYFCSSPALSSYSFVKRNVLVDWFKYYNDIGVKKVTFNDATLNKVDFDVLLDGLININNQVKIHTTDISFRDLKFDQIPKMKQAGFDEVCLGLECLHPTLQKKINRKMPSIDDLFKYLDLFEINDINVKLFYIIGLPFQTFNMFLYELNIIEEIDKKYSNIQFEIYNFYISPKSFAEKNYLYFNTKKTSIYDEYINDLQKYNKNITSMYKYEQLFPSFEDGREFEKMFYDKIKNTLTTFFPH